DAQKPARQLLFRTSFDGGARWEPASVVAPYALEGPIAHDPGTGALYVALYDHGIRMARSLDAGATWTLWNVTREQRDFTLRNGNPTDTHVVTAVDARGSVYVVWSQDAPDASVKGSKALSV